MFEQDYDDEIVLLETLLLDPVRQTRIPVAPCMEVALGYRGARRFVAFQTHRSELVYWTDGVEDGWSVVTIWDQFVNHPLIAPHLRGYRLKPRLDHQEAYLTVELFMKNIGRALGQMGDSIALDRKKRIVLAGPLPQVLLFIAVAGAFEEPPALSEYEEPNGDPQMADAAAQMELLEWLDQRAMELGIGTR